MEPPRGSYLVRFVLYIFCVSIIIICVVSCLTSLFWASLSGILRSRLGFEIHISRSKTKKVTWLSKRLRGKSIKYNQKLLFAYLRLSRLENSLSCATLASRRHTKIAGRQKQQGFQTRSRRNKVCCQTWFAMPLFYFSVDSMTFSLQCLNPNLPSIHYNAL